MSSSRGRQCRWGWSLTCLTKIEIGAVRGLLGGGRWGCRGQWAYGLGMYHAGFECIEKPLSISALIGDIGDVRSSTFYRLGMSISAISDRRYVVGYHRYRYTGLVCVEKSLSISALIGDIGDVRSSKFYRLGMSISTISDRRYVVGYHRYRYYDDISTIIDRYLADT